MGYKSNRLEDRLKSNAVVVAVDPPGKLMGDEVKHLVIEAVAGVTVCRRLRIEKDRNVRIWVDGIGEHRQEGRCRVPVEGVPRPRFHRSPCLHHPCFASSGKRPSFTART